MPLRRKRPTLNAQRPTSNAQLRMVRHRAAMSGRRSAASLPNHGDHLELDRNWGRQRADLYRGASWIGLARAGEMLGIEAIVDRKIFFHVREKDRHIDDVLPCCAGVFQNEPHVLE